MAGSSIVPIDYKKDGDLDIVSKVLSRYSCMRSERINFHSERETCELQVAAPLFENNHGKPEVNSPIEQNLLEIHTGRNATDLRYDIKPNAQANTEDLVTAKYALDFFLDKENFYREKQLREYDKAKYGTGILYCGIRMETEKKYVVKEGVEISMQPGGGYDDDKILQEVTKYHWFFTPKNVRIWDLYIDDRAVRQPRFEKAEDCIMVEYISREKLEQRWGDNKNFDIEDLSESIRDDHSKSPTTGQIKLRYYFNKNTKDYIIIGNEKQLVHKNKMKYQSGKLPFAVAQHYQDNETVYGKSIPRKIRLAKVYKNNMLQAMLDKVMRSRSPKILLGNGNDIDGDFYATGDIDIWRTTKGPSDFQQFQFDGNIGQFQQVVEFLNDEIRQDSGEDPRAGFEAPEDTLGQTEIVEENKAIRVKSISESRDIALDFALTFTLENIKQFAPAVLKSTTKIGKGKDAVTKIERPKIIIPGVKVEKKGKKQIIEKEDDYGKYGYYELNPDSLTDDLTVRVITPSTYNKTLNVIEKNRVNELINNLKVFAEVYGPEAIQEVTSSKNLWDFISQAYGYDPEGDYTATTKKQREQEKALEKAEKLEKLFSTNPEMNDQAVSAAQAPEGQDTGLGVSAGDITGGMQGIEAQASGIPGAGL